MMLVFPSALTAVAESIHLSQRMIVRTKTTVWAPQISRRCLRLL